MSELEAALGNVVEAVRMLEESPEFARLVPEVRVNLVYALPGARTPKEVVAVDGRITVVRGMPRAAGLPALGASDHMARLIVEVQKYDLKFNAGINFKCDRLVIEVAREYCSERGLRFGWIDRTKEPEEVSRQDGSSMPWKVKQLYERSGGIPHLFYEGEGWGKEPLFVALADNAMEAAAVALIIARRYCEKAR